MLPDPSRNLFLFANARAGGGAAKAIIRIFSKTIGDDHVFDLAHDNPRDVLADILQGTSTTSTTSTSSASSALRASPRIIVAGGDGTITWILGLIADLTAAHPTVPPPPVAILPLGTGNDLAINLGWGKTFHSAAIKTAAGLNRTTARIADAATTLVDHWNVRFDDMPFPAHNALPHALRLRDTPRPGGSDGEHGTLIGEPPAGRPASSATSTFWNYLSIGLDALTAYRFHSLRERHPACTSSRIINQAWYGVFTCSTGWFCGGQRLANNGPSAHDRPASSSFPAAPRTRIISRLRIKKRAQDDTYTDVHIPDDIRAIVLLNLQTYGGGRDIWGLDNERNLARKGLQQPRKNDGLLEVIGFRNGWHTALVMGEVATQRVHGKRLGQGCAVEVTFDNASAESRKRRKHVCMQLDGEPWKQELGAVDDVGVVGDVGDVGDGVDGARRRPPRLVVTWGGQSLMLDGSRAAEQPSSRAAEQPNSRTAEQPNSRAAEQPSSRAAEQSSDENPPTMKLPRPHL